MCVINLVLIFLVRDFFSLDDEGIVKVYFNFKGVWCKVDDIVEVVLFLVSDEFKFVSGYNFVVDGGFIIMNLGFCMFEE